jgi:CBS domain containing-hemolysin-like protein
VSDGLFFLAFVVASLGLALSGLLSGAEAGAYALNRVRLRTAVAHGDRRARLVTRLLGNLPALVATLVVGRTLAQAVVSFSVTLALESSSLASGAEVFSVLLVAPTVVILGELAPKELFRRHADNFLFLAAPTIAIVSAVLAPVTWLMLLFPRALRASGLMTLPDEGAASLDELRLLLDVSEEEGTLLPKQASAARAVLALGERKVESRMTPVERVAALDVATPIGEAREIAARAGRSRLLVRRGAHAAGAVSFLDLFLGEEATVLSLVKPVPSLSPGESVEAALERLKRAREGFAVVASADGHVLGIVTLADLVAEALGREVIA